MTGSIFGQSGRELDAPDQCSAKDCRADATVQLRWNNPKIHTPDRRKIWLACDEHRQHLTDFLTARKFLREVVQHPGDQSDEADQAND